MFVLVQTSVGYFDILVFLKSPLKEAEDFSCSFYIDESRSNGMSDGGSNSTSERLLCGPILFSSIMDSNKLSGQFTVMLPELLNHKSVYVIVKLEHAASSKSGATTDAGQQSKSTTQNDFLISEILKEVYVGVYQFKALAPNSFYFPGCRNVLLRDTEFHQNLMDQFLELVEANVDTRPGYELQLILDLFAWIVSVYTSSDQSNWYVTLQPYCLLPLLKIGGWF